MFFLDETPSWGDGLFYAYNLVMKALALATSPPDVLALFLTYQNDGTKLCSCRCELTSALVGWQCIDCS